MRRFTCPRCRVQMTVNTTASTVTCPRCLMAIAGESASQPPALPRRVIPLEDEVRRDLGVSRAALFCVVLALVIGVVGVWRWVANASPYDQPQDVYFKHPVAVLGTLFAIIACMVAAAILFSRRGRLPARSAADGSDADWAARKRADDLSQAGRIVTITLASLLSIIGTFLLIVLGFFLLVRSICGP